eukprot:GFYU01043084.1.p1 GENE.GFYU01043084.1~~GFYU01043084.1.p1  ORF type:complete len:307 (+),score=46.43 GFYU01043084.1:98-1018(+)
MNIAASFRCVYVHTRAHLNRVTRPLHSQHGKQLTVEGVKHILAVASGKGGVGKSTTSVNLAVAMSLQGRKVGLLDADIYGPSIPRMMNLTGKKPKVSDDKMLQPITNYNVQCMSMGFLVPENDAVIWRGPMVMGALQQMLTQVEWGDLDVLVIDLPPGTGDAQLTLTQQVAVSGAVIVSTPQDIALLDARRGVAMFEKVNVPILGLVENMSYYVCPNCDHEDHIFGHDGAKHYAKEMSLPFAGAIPLHRSIREKSDGGQPTALVAADTPHGKAYHEIAAGLLHKLDALSTSTDGAATSKGPKITIE